MRLIAISVAACSLFVYGCSGNSVPPAIPSDHVIEEKIDSLIRKMTLEEKIGQMTEITVGVVTDKSGTALSEEMLDTVIGKYKVGSILNIPFGVGQPKEVFAGVVRRIQEKSIEETGIPCIYGLDQIHGASYTQGATFFPQGINMAATFNRGLARRSGEITAYETRACLVPWTYAPVMDLGRDPRWPRMWESYGEDSYLNAEMAVSVVKGLQGEDPNHVGPYHIASCIKHYMGYGVPVSGKDRTPAVIAPHDLREKYFAPFKECIDAGALTLMVNSASINGIPCHCNRELLTGWLKEDLNWDGMIVTDWNDINNLYTRDKVAVSKKDAVRLAVNAGIDMAMVPSELQFCIDLKELVQEGAVPMSRIDDAVRRVLRLKFRLGLFDNPFWDLSAYENAEIALGYDIGFTSGGEVVQPDTVITVRLKVTDEIASASGEGYTLLHLHGGEWSEVSYTIDNGYAVFTVTEFSDFLFITATPATSLVWLIVVLAVLLAVEIILLVVVIVKRRKGRN